MSELFEPHEIQSNHVAGCPGCIAKMIELEVTRQVNDTLGKFLEKLQKEHLDD